MSPLDRDAREWKREAIAQWTAEPAGAHLARTARRDTADFYAQVEEARYDLYPWLKTYLERDGWRRCRILEVGVGLGTDHLVLHRRGAKVTGIDLAPDSIAHAERRLGLEGHAADLHVADAERLPFEQGRFDVVYAFGVIHHTPDMDAAVSEIHRVLRPGGTALVAVYNRHSYFHAWRLLRRLLDGSWRRTSREQMRAGFEYGDGTPLVRLSSRSELVARFRTFSSVDVQARHLPTNRLPRRARPLADTLLRPLERWLGWYWIVDARK